jgi:choline kinase
MKAVILAAGQGRRLTPMGWDKPKCLLPCGTGSTNALERWGELASPTLLDSTLQSILEHGIRDVIIVVGYRRELVENAARRHATNCEFIVNEDYATTNTIHSLWLAREYLNEGIIYFNSDVWFEPPVLSFLLQSAGRRRSALLVEVKRCGAEEVKVQVDPSGRITRIGKNLPPEEAFGEFIGLGKFEQSACVSLVESLWRYNEELGRKDYFFESALADILDRHTFMAAPLGDLKAVEIDTPEDYARAQSLWMV